MKSAVFERQQDNIPEALALLSKAIKRYLKFAKFYMIQGQIHQSRKDYPAARTPYATGLKTCPKDVTLWILASRLEEVDGKSIKSRALLDKARLVNPATDVLWTEAVGVDERAGSTNKVRLSSRAGCKNALHPEHSGRWRSGLKRVRQERQTARTR
jgi:pre-mRNA-processing factor 6